MAHPFATAPARAAEPTLDDLLTDADLRDLAADDHFRALGELSPEHQRLLAMTLPEICGALLALRAERTAHTAGRGRAA